MLYFLPEESDPQDQQFTSEPFDTIHSRRKRRISLPGLQRAGSIGWDREIGQLGSHGLSWLNSLRSRLLEQNQKYHLLSVTCFVFSGKADRFRKEETHRVLKNQEELSMYACVHAYVSHLYMFMHDCVCVHLYVMVNVIICYFRQERVKMYKYSSGS